MPMSRSYKKYPHWHNNSPQHVKAAKKFAKRKLRRYLGAVQNGKWYRKLYSSWDIRDWITVYHGQKCERDWMEKYYSIQKMSRK